MMDVQPIAVKKEGELGEGSTFEMTGVYMLLTDVYKRQCTPRIMKNLQFSAGVKLG